MVMGSMIMGFMVMDSGMSLETVLRLVAFVAGSFVVGIGVIGRSWIEQVFLSLVVLCHLRHWKPFLN